MSKHSSIVVVEDAHEAEQQPLRAAAPPNHAYRRPLEQAGELVGFTLHVIRELPVAMRLYPTEVFRQAGLLIRSNALVVFFMLFMLGALLGITGSVLFETVGLESYVGAITAIPMMRGGIEIVFGWVLAAKAGCGIVAELGAMRISEEVDAMEVMGVRSIPYLVGTRVLAAMMVLPFLFASSLGVHFIASKLFFVDVMGAVSSGGFSNILFMLQDGRDLTIAVFWGVLLGFTVTVVACYYGFTASGGPVGVGRNTAQSMLVNLVLISVMSMTIAQIFYAGALNEAYGT
jgi:phospholipid/cholesterol/gamma-HCH transport system permease protein